MSRSAINNTKLGIFVLAGLLFLVMTLFIIGKNRSFFGSYYSLRANFKNIYGLTRGNNVRYSGIQIGTVNDIKLLSDTVIEISFTVKKDMAKFIRVDDMVTIGGEGLMGNKVLNINPSSGTGTFVKDGDLLKSKATVNLDKMIEILGETTNDIRTIAGELQITINRINNSTAIWNLLKDENIPANIRKSVENVVAATQSVQISATELNGMVASVSNGKGNLGILLRDSSMALQLNKTIALANETVKNTNQIADDLHTFISSIDNDVRNGKGIVNGLLRNETMTTNLANSLANIENATNSLNQNLEALKHNIFFRGYFKKQEKAKRKAEQAAAKN